MNGRKRIATLVASLLLALFASCSAGLFDIGGVPYLHPFPVLLAIPSFLGLGWWFSLALVPPIYLVWSPQLLEGDPRIPVRTVVAYWVILALSCLYFAFCWQDGVHYQGQAFTKGAAVLNLAMALIAVSFLYSARKTPSFIRSLLAHWLIFAWALSYAFPYLGEGP